MSTSFRNFTIGDVKRRRGKERVTSESFYDLAERLRGQHNAYAMFLSYPQEFRDFYETQQVNERGEIIKPAWSVKDWSGDVPAYFVDVPVDFDASDGIEHAYTQCHAFIQTELIERGIDKRYFTLYLSGGKGFHIHISASCFNVVQPVANAGFRLKNLVHMWKEKYDRIDLSIYNSTALFRLPGSKHKSGLYKTEIALEDFNLDHIRKADEWAIFEPITIRIPEQTSPPVLIDLPEARLPQLAIEYEFDDFDEESEIIPNCKWLQAVMADPSNGGKDGDGRDKRRIATGILLSASPPGVRNRDLTAFVRAVEQHPYMDETRMGDVHKWIREYDRDGEIKSKKKCYQIGCDSVQRNICGTLSPLDWKLKKTALDVVSSRTNRKRLAEVIKSIIAAEGNSVNVACLPVGIGKTFTLMEECKEQGLTTFYTSPTHALARQTASDFESRGIGTRHVASRAYLADNEDFECLFPNEVSLAIQNKLGSHTVCSKCPRKRRKDEHGEYAEPETGYTPCDYWEQFEGLEDVTAVIGVHQHLFEYMYDAAAVAARSLTVIDESPLQSLTTEIAAIEPSRLEPIKAEAERVLREERNPGGVDTPAVRTGMFSRILVILNEQLHQLQESEKHHKLPVWQAFTNMFHGRPFDTQLIEGLSRDAIRAFWYEFAGRIAINLGWHDEYGIDAESAYLCIPFPVQNAMALAAMNTVYDPEYDFYLPAQLPENKVLILDATASSDAYGEVMKFVAPDREFKFHQMPLTSQDYSHTTQIVDSSYGVSKLYDEDTQSKISYAIIKLLGKHPGPSLVVCHKQHAGFWKSELRNYKQVEVATFGSLKGINRWAKFSAQYIVGTPFVPDQAIAQLAAKFGAESNLMKIRDSAILKSSVLLAKNGDTAVIQRRIYGGLPFHTALAQMLSQWEVTQAVRLRLYDKHTDEKQHLYIFSNVELKGMYADEFKKLDALTSEFTPIESVVAAYEEKSAAGQRTRNGYESLERWFESIAVGSEFTRDAIPAVTGERAIRMYLSNLVEAGKIDRIRTGKSFRFVKLH